MNNVIEERRKQEERSKKIMRDVERTGKKFEQELENISAVEEHMAEVEKKTVSTDKKLKTTDEKLTQTEVDVKKVHERIKKIQELKPEKTNTEREQNK